MKTTLLALLCFLTIGAHAQIDALTKSADLGQRMFGESEDLQLDFEKEYTFKDAYSYELSLDGPALEKKKKRQYQVYVNQRDSTTLLIDRSQDLKSLHDATLDGVLSLRNQGISPCVQLRKTLDGKKKAIVYSETGKVEIIEGWKCAEFVYEDAYHLYTLWVNLDEDHQLMIKQLGTLLSIPELVTSSLPSGTLVKFEIMRKSTSLNEQTLVLSKKTSVNFSLDTEPCFEIQERKNN